MTDMFSRLAYLAEHSVSPFRVAFRLKSSGPFMLLCVFTVRRVGHLQTQQLSILISTLFDTLIVRFTHA